MKRREFWVVFGLAVAALAWPVANLISQSPGGVAALPWGAGNATASANERMLMSVTVHPNGMNQLVLVDTTKQVMSTYWVAPDSGMIMLKSVRNLASDFQLEEFNGTDPSPAKVRGILSPTGSR